MIQDHHTLQHHWIGENPNQKSLDKEEIISIQEAALILENDTDYN